MPQKNLQEKPKYNVDNVIARRISHKKHTSTCSMCHPNALNGKWGDRTLAMADET